ncbi:MAG: discoidin domain-containing protein [Bacteroidales bacterium]|jgi:hypothetical protein|nr:discoidin domain-containing protein [Bacteroidales bacterium]
MKYLIYSTIVFISACLIVSCDDMYDIHQKYLDEGEEVYIGYPDIVAANGGFERIQLIWKLNADPKIAECCIYWNDREDSLTVPVNRTDTAMIQIIPLPEGKYIMEMVNKSRDGYCSLFNTVSVESYGEIYRKGLYNRLVTSQVAAENNITLQWSLEEGCVGTKMSYINKNGQEKEVFIKADQTTLVLDDYVSGGAFSYVSLFVPETSAIDTIATNATNMDFAVFYRELSRTGWSITASSVLSASYPATNVLDGNTSTMWHSLETGPFPYTLELDMQQVYEISKIAISRRNHTTMVTDTRTVVIEAKENAGDNFVTIAEYDFGPSSTDLTGEIILPGTVNARYVNVLITAGNRGYSASLSEIRIYELGN